MKIDTLVVGPFGVNCYLVHDGARALIVDPGDEADVIIQTLKDNSLTPCCYVLTHGHIDHISALPAMLTEFPCPVLISARDAAWAFSETNQLAPFYKPVTTVPEDIQPLDDRLTFDTPAGNCRVIPTPGHSPGSVCLYFPEQGVLLSGDTLFKESVGRTDLPGGDEAMLTKSLCKLMELPDNTVVYTGHGPETNIRAERTNPFVRMLGV